MVHRVKMNWRFFLGNNTERTDLITRRRFVNMFEDSQAKQKKKKKKKEKKKLAPIELGEGKYHSLRTTEAQFVRKIENKNQSFNQ